MSYKLPLPPNSTIHPVFHFSLLKKKLGDTITLQDLPVMANEELVVAPDYFETREESASRPS